jgi:predicted phosphate transport protein (TIGR00153 family)
VFRLLPTHVDYCDAFERAAQNAVDSAELLADLASASQSGAGELVAAIIQAEHEGDRLARETFDRLARSNFSPADREDIYDLVSRIDDVVDMIDAVGQRMSLYKIATTENDFVRQCALLVKASRLASDAVSQIRHIEERKPPALSTAVDQLMIVMHQAEEEGDVIHHHVLTQLFDGRLDAFEVIKWKELYGLVEQAIDLCDDVTCVVHRIVAKNG